MLLPSSMLSLSPCPPMGNHFCSPQTHIHRLQGHLKCSSVFSFLATLLLLLFLFSSSYFLFLSLVSSFSLSLFLSLSSPHFLILPHLLVIPSSFLFSLSLSFLSSPFPCVRILSSSLCLSLSLSLSFPFPSDHVEIRPPKKTEHQKGKADLHRTFSDKHIDNTSTQSTHSPTAYATPHIHTIDIERVRARSS